MAEQTGEHGDHGGHENQPLPEVRQEQPSQPDGAASKRERTTEYDAQQRRVRAEAARAADESSREEMAAQARWFFDSQPGGRPGHPEGGRPGGGEALPAGPLNDQEIGQLIDWYPTQLADNYEPEQLEKATANVKAILRDFDASVPFRDRVATIQARLNELRQRNRKPGRETDPMTDLTNRIIKKLNAYGKDPASGRRSLQRAGIDLRPTEPMPPVRPAYPEPPVPRAYEEPEPPARARRDGPAPYDEDWASWEPLRRSADEAAPPWQTASTAPQEPVSWRRNDTGRDADPGGWRPSEQRPGEAVLALPREGKAREQVAARQIEIDQLRVEIRELEASLRSARGAKEWDRLKNKRLDPTDPPEVLEYRVKHSKLRHLEQDQAREMGSETYGSAPAPVEPGKKRR